MSYRIIAAIVAGESSVLDKDLRKNERGSATKRSSTPHGDRSEARMRRQTERIRTRTLTLLSS